MKKYIVVIVIALVSYLAGRYSAPEIVKVETKIVEVEKEVVKKEKQVVRVKENTDGSKETVIVTDSQTEEKTEANSKTESKEVISYNRTNISLLAGTSVPINMVYGINVSKPILGPITAGAWALSNGTIGLSLGLNF